MNDLEQMTACLEQIKPVKKEYPGLAFVVTIFLAYTFWFLGTAYGINRGAGYEIRYVFSAISLIVVNTVSYTHLSRPSQEDIKLAFDSNASYMIISFMAENPVLNSFHIENGQVEKEDLRIYSDEYYF